jgi:hypothetical protein
LLPPQCYNGQSFIKEKTKEKKTDNELQNTTQKIKEQHEPTTVCADNSRLHGDDVECRHQTLNNTRMNNTKSRNKQAKNKTDY